MLVFSSGDTFKTWLDQLPVHGQKVAEHLFILAALAGKENVRIVVAPTDFRRNPVQLSSSAPPWLPALYEEIQAALNEFPVDVPQGGLTHSR